MVSATMRLTWCREILNFDIVGVAILLLAEKIDASLSILQLPTVKIDKSWNEAAVLTRNSTTKITKKNSQKADYPLETGRIRKDGLDDTKA